MIPRLINNRMRHGAESFIQQAGLLHLHYNRAIFGILGDHRGAPTGTMDLDKANTGNFHSETEILNDLTFNKDYLGRKVLLKTISDRLMHWSIPLWGLFFGVLDAFESAANKTFPELDIVNHHFDIISYALYIVYLAGTLYKGSSINTSYKRRLSIGFEEKFSSKWKYGARHQDRLGIKAGVGPYIKITNGLLGVGHLLGKVRAIDLEYMSILLDIINSDNKQHHLGHIDADNDIQTLDIDNCIYATHKTISFSLLYHQFLETYGPNLTESIMSRIASYYLINQEFLNLSCFLDTGNADIGCQDYFYRESSFLLSHMKHSLATIESDYPQIYQDIINNFILYLQSICTIIRFKVHNPQANMVDTWHLRHVYNLLILNSYLGIIGLESTFISEIRELIFLVANTLLQVQPSQAHYFVKKMFATELITQNDIESLIPDFQKHEDAKEPFTLYSESEGYIRQIRESIITKMPQLAFKGLKKGQNIHFVPQVETLRSCNIKLMDKVTIECNLKNSLLHIEDIPSKIEHIKQSLIELKNERKETQFDVLEEIQYENGKIKLVFGCNNNFSRLASIVAECIYCIEQEMAPCIPEQKQGPIVTMPGFTISQN